MDFQVVGEVPSTFEPRNTPTPLDAEILKAMRDVNIEPKGNYKICQVEMQGMLESLNKYNNKSEFRPIEKYYQLALKYTEKMYDGMYQIKNPATIKVNEKAQSGYPWNTAIGTKGGVMSQYWDDVMEYCFNPNGRVLWTAMGKMKELLSKTKADLK